MSLGPDKLVHLIEAREVVHRLGRGFAERVRRAVQSAEDFSNGNQAVSFAVHGFHSPMRLRQRGGTSVQNDSVLSQIYQEYRHLDDESRDARYELIESRIISRHSKQREDCFQKAVIKRGLRCMRRSALRARSFSSP